MKAYQYIPTILSHAQINITHITHTFVCAHTHARTYSHFVLLERNSKKKKKKGMGIGKRRKRNRRKKRDTHFKKG